MANVIRSVASRDERLRDDLQMPAVPPIADGSLRCSETTRRPEAAISAPLCSSTRVNAECA